MIEIVQKKPNGEIFTTSLLVAEKFGKRHDTILRKIEGEPDDDFTRRNFAVSGYVDKSGRTVKMYELTRDGFSCDDFSHPNFAAAKYRDKKVEAGGEFLDV